MIVSPLINLVKSLAEGVRVSLKTTGVMSKRSWTFFRPNFDGLVPTLLISLRVLFGRSSGFGEGSLLAVLQVLL